MSAMASQIIGVSIVCSNVCLGAHQRKTVKFRVTGLCEGNLPVTGGFPSQMASNAEKGSIWWRHHDNRSPENPGIDYFLAGFIQWRYTPERGAQFAFFQCLFLCLVNFPDVGIKLSYFMFLSPFLSHSVEIYDRAALARYAQNLIIGSTSWSIVHLGSHLGQHRDSYQTSPA